MVFVLIALSLLLVAVAYVAKTNAVENMNLEPFLKLLIILICIFILVLIAMMIYLWTVIGQMMSQLPSNVFG